MSYLKQFIKQKSEHYLNKISAMLVLSLIIYPTVNGIIYLLLGFINGFILFITIFVSLVIGLLIMIFFTSDKLNIQGEY